MLVLKAKDSVDTSDTPPISVSTLEPANTMSILSQPETCPVSTNLSTDKLTQGSLTWVLEHI